MSGRYRNREELREIVKAIIAESGTTPLDSFDLSPSEEVYFRARAARAVERVAREACTFKAYYTMPTERPFSPVVFISVVVLLADIVAALEVYWRTKANPAYPLFAALLTVAAVAAGWLVVGGIAHRNTVRQNTTNLLFARFSQAPFGDAMHRFHKQFGYGLDARITRPQVYALIDSGDDEELKAAGSVGYLLNYFEFIGEGVLRGDLDRGIIERNLRGVLCYYYDKCEPFIQAAQRDNPRVYEHLVKLRTHYREP